MNTKFDMNQKVRLVGTVSGIHTDARGTKYVISVRDGCSDCDEHICVTEEMLIDMEYLVSGQMNKEESERSLVNEILCRR